MNARIVRADGSDNEQEDKITEQAAVQYAARGGDLVGINFVTRLNQEVLVYDSISFVDTDRVLFVGSLAWRNCRWPQGFPMLLPKPDWLMYSYSQGGEVPTCT